MQKARVASNSGAGAEASGEFSAVATGAQKICKINGTIRAAFLLFEISGHEAGLRRRNR
jgi:hypothetical protein